GKSATNVPFMMPARLASTPADQQIKEVVGSGPFKFAKDEWQPGEQAVYVRNPDYVPRDEPPRGSTGGKRAYLDKVIWRFMTEPGEGGDDPGGGEVEGGEGHPRQFTQNVEQTAPLKSFLVDPVEERGCLSRTWRPPPFNNKKARQALLYATDQVTYLHWSVG